MGSPRNHVLRIYLTGRIGIETQGRILGQEAFPNTQSLLVFARLAMERHHAVSRDELVALLWPEKVPSAWEVSLSAVISRLRSLLQKIGLKKSEALSNALGCYQIHLPESTWIDVEAAAEALHEAEGAKRARDYAKCYGWGHVAYQIARRPFLAGQDASWIDQEREKLNTIFVRSCENLAEFYIWNGEPSLAVEAAKQVVTREPYRETGYQLLMRAHAAAGNRAEALWVYEKCRKLISEELGADPSPATKEVYHRVLRSTRR